MSSEGSNTESGDRRRPAVGVVRETNDGERRVALVPKVVPSLIAKGLDVIVEAGAGQNALIPDAAYKEAGATIGDAWSADIVVKVAPPSDAEVARLKSGQKLIGFLAPRNAENQIGALATAGVEAYAVEAIPRISRAQVMDALSSQGNVSGYKAVLVAASESTRFFPMLTTAAGTVKPATVLVLGVGVAGLQLSPPPSVSVAVRPDTTCDPRSPIRCGRWARSGSTSASMPQARAGTPVSSPKKNALSSSRHSRMPSRASMSSSPPRWCRVALRRVW